MKVLVVIGLLLLLLVLLYRRLRPYRKIIGEFIKTIRHLQTVHQGNLTADQKPEAEKLVCCEVCATWVPESKSFSSGNKIYCSRECLAQKAARGRSR